MKLLKINQKGIAHILAPVLFIAIFAAIGGYVLLKSHAAATTEYVGGQVRLNSKTGALVGNATVTLRAQYDNGTYYYYTKPLNTSSPGLYISWNKVTVGRTYVMTAHKVINNVKYCSGRELVYMYAVGGTNPLREKDFVISKSAC